MKIRMRGNSVRLGLNPGDVEKMRSDGLVQDTVDFGDGHRLTYALMASPTASAMSASFSNFTITVYVPVADIDAWAASDQASLGGEQALGEGDALSLRVEKD